MNILQAIAEHKRVEIMKRKQKRPLPDLRSFPHYGRATNQVDTAGLSQSPGIIAEFKRKSPSKGDLHPDADPVEVAKGYGEAGVTAMSILTDRDFFGGSFRDLLRVREALDDLVLLRKDFILDPYQLHETSAYGADMVLLIAALLEKHQVEELALEASSLGLEVLFEVHRVEELEKLHPSIRFVGVNNRDLTSFTVDTDLGLEMIRHLPPAVVPVSESGITSTEEIRKLYRAGYRLFLMGERFMKQPDPGQACREFIRSLSGEMGAG
ncbi:MAG: indole-3-glycerol phosphate synthase TrpC [Bacteroidales bacterium]